MVVGFNTCTHRGGIARTVLDFYYTEGGIIRKLAVLPRCGKLPKYRQSPILVSLS